LKVVGIEPSGIVERAERDLVIDVAHRDVQPACEAELTQGMLSTMLIPETLPASVVPTGARMPAESGRPSTDQTASDDETSTGTQTGGRAGHY
jgi:hypothetical protein